MGSVDLDVDVQAVVAKQHRKGIARRAGVAYELPRIRQAHRTRTRGDPQAVPIAVANDRVGGRVGVACARERDGGVEFTCGALDDKLATRRVVAGPLLAARGLRDRVSAVESVVQATPARIGGVQREARVHHGNDELRTGDVGNLNIDVGGGDLEIAAFGHQVADLRKQCLVCRRVVPLTPPLPMPGVDLGLEFVSLGEQRPVLGRQIVNDGAEARPERIDIDARAGQRLARDEVVQFPCHLKTVAVDSVGHDASLNRTDEW